MDSFHRKTLVTQRLLKYTYFISPPKEHTQHGLPALFFIHGFPDSAHLWSDVIARLAKLPHKVIVPDCLGYAGTDKPEDTTAYAYKDQADDLVDILHHENVKSTVLIGHDWGSALAQRTYLHHRALISGMILLNTAYIVPSKQPFDLAAANSFSQKTFGYPQFPYWEFFIAPDAHTIIDGNLEKMWQVLHGDVEQWMKKMFCIPNAMRQFLTSEENVPLKSYASQSKWKDRFLQQFKTDGFAATLQMYKATASNIQWKSDSIIANDSLVIEVPTLFVACTADAVCPPKWIEEAKDQGLVPDLKEVFVDCAHWSPMEKPDEIAMHVREFVLGRFPSR